ncbi:MAG: hypothetical protein K0Q55_4072 [Verrucomicrobia bacterium]|jgi:hypothetical protein|nr:hypothetical protein [Verrucomicrobiota bacterium]
MKAVNHSLGGRPGKASGLVLVELLVVLAVILVVGVIVTVASYRLRSEHQFSRIRCESNLRMIGLSFKMFAGDNDSHFPFTTTNSIAYQNTSNAWLHFLSLSNELGSSKILVCPEDHCRWNLAANTFYPVTNSDLISLTYVQNKGVSYFLNVDASETKPDMVLLGDRNVFSPGQQPKGSLLELAGTNELEWTGSLHTNRGMVALSDGSVSLNVKTIPAWRNHPDKVRLLLP